MSLDNLRFGQISSLKPAVGRGLTKEEILLLWYIASAKGTIQKPGKMVAQKSGLNRSILRQGWYKFQTLLKYKCDWYGSYLQLVSPHFSSQTCSECWHVDKKSRVSQSVFSCTKCNHTENADTNASKVILTRGLRGSACGAAA